jgi:hypothetical protein
VVNQARQAKNPLLQHVRACGITYEGGNNKNNNNHNNHSSSSSSSSGGSSGGNGSNPLAPDFVLGESCCCIFIQVGLGV